MLEEGFKEETNLIKEGEHKGFKALTPIKEELLILCMLRRQAPHKLLQDKAHTKHLPDLSTRGRTTDEPSKYGVSRL